MSTPGPASIESSTPPRHSRCATRPVQPVWCDAPIPALHSDAVGARFRIGARLFGGESLRALARHKVRSALTALVLTTVALTALLIHLFWSYTARLNVADVVGQLNRQIVGSIQHELHGVLDAALAMQEAVRSILFQGTIKTADEGKREFVFLALLRSQPSLSWISLGFPDGGFFGSRKASDSEIDMIEVKWDPATHTARQRTD